MPTTPSSKASKAKQTMTDVTPPAKTAASSQKLVISSRPMMERDEVEPTDSGSDIETPTEPTSKVAEAPSAPAVPAGAQPAQAPTPTAPSASKKVITPLDASLSEDTSETTNEPTAPVATQSAPAEAATPEPKAEPTTETQPATTDEPTAEPVESDTEDTTSNADDSNPAVTDEDKEVQDTKKAVEEARREQEVKEYIQNKQFFVPINQEARKRSIKVSFALILVLAILGAVLIDLMLDSGLIILIQKIPHTHFFTGN